MIVDYMRAELIACGVRSPLVVDDLWLGVQEVALRGRLTLSDGAVVESPLAWILVDYAYDGVIGFLAKNVRWESKLIRPELQLVKKQDARLNARPRLTVVRRVG